MTITHSQTTAETWKTRRYLRLDANKTAELSDGEGGTVSIRILDMSAAGARLQIDRPFEFPETFSLSVTTSARTEGVTVRCRLRWQRDLEAGVTFF